MPELSGEAQRTFYNLRSEGFAFIRNWKLQRCIQILSAIAETKLVDPRIIELGCGTGWLTSILGTIGPAVGVDLADAAIERASERYPHVAFIAADIPAWEYPKGSFDIVVSHEVLEHVKDQDGYLEVACGLLRTGGWLILTTPNRDTFAALSPGAAVAFDPQPIENTLNVGEVRSLLLRRLAIVRVTTIVPGHGVKGAYRIASSQSLRAFLGKLGVSWIFDGLAVRLGFGLHILATARKA